MANVAVAVGSPPLSRGIRQDGGDRARCGRIIPALAGNTLSEQGIAPWSRDHPRSHGEYFFRADVGNSIQGSSPLSRGILLQELDPRQFLRIIPALAGNTCQTWDKL